MKKEVQRVSDEVLGSYPIQDLLDGWFFRIREVSNGMYEVEGINVWGRKVTRTGMESEPDEVLTACAVDARQIQSNIDKA